MKKQAEAFEEKILLLKEARLQLLKLHKLLVDSERENYENENGKITSGHFLNLLVDNANFAWLRKFSILIVEIDEMLDLDDGYTINMIEKQFSQMRNLLNMEITDEEFKTKYKDFLQKNSEIAGKHGEIKTLLEKKN